MSFSTVLTFASVFLLERGFSNQEIGYVIAIAGFISAILQPMIGDLADRNQKISLHHFIIGLAGVMIMIAALLLFQAENLFLTGFLYGALIAVLQMMTPLVNSLGMYFIDRGIPINFGIARGIGSLLYAVASYSIGFLVECYGTGVVMIATIMIFLFLTVSVVTFRFTVLKDREKRKQEQKKVAGFAAAHVRFMILLAGIILLFTSHNMLNNFVFQTVSYHGAGSKEMGMVSALAALCELPTMFAFSRVVKKISAGSLIKISGIFFTLKSLITYLAPNMAVIYFAQIFQMLGFALFIVASVYYVSSVIETQYQVKGQAYMTMTNTAGSVIGSLLGGFLLDHTGLPSMLLVSTAMAATGMLIIFVTAESHSTH